MGALGLGYVLNDQRSGYFPRRVANPMVKSGRLHLVPGAPVFPYPAYVVHHMSLEADILSAALEEMRRIAQAVDQSDPGRDILGQTQFAAPSSDTIDGTA